jgi:hypothetical protein
VVRGGAHVKAHVLGAQSFKNVSAPLAVYALAAAEAEPAHPAPRRFGMLWAALASVLVLAAVIALGRNAILTWVALNAPRVFSHPIR